jgi:hypothetical protein
MMTMGIGFYPTAYVGQRPLQLVGVCPKEAVRGGNNRIINPLALATRGRGRDKTTLRCCTAKASQGSVAAMASHVQRRTLLLET